MTTSGTGATARHDVAALKRAHQLDKVVAAAGVRLRRAGKGRYLALCPFHDDRHPSLLIDVRDPEREHFHCFSPACAVHGDVIDFVMLSAHLDFRAACAHLALAGGAPPLAPRVRPTGTPVSPPPRAARPPAGERRWDRLTPAEQAVMNVAGAVYRAGLRHSPAARAYLRARGVAPGVAARCGLGFADGAALLAALPHERDRALAAALERIARTRPKPRTRREGDGVAHDTTADEQGKSGGKRNKHRPPKQDRDDSPQQGTLPEPAGSGVGEAADAVDPGSDATGERDNEGTGERDENTADGDDGGEGVRP